MVHLLLLIPLLSAVVTQDECARPVLLPAYAHNDYRNPHPLVDALLLGYRGVEADIFRVDNELLVGHDRDALEHSRTLTKLYLEPLVHRQRECGYLLADSTPFLLTIELKQHDLSAFRMLASELNKYQGLFVATAPMSRAPVQVTLVGWWPSTESDSSWPPFLTVHIPLERTVPAREHLLEARLGLVSIDYGKALKWSGRGRVPEGAAKILATARELAAAYDVPIRVHHAPEHEAIYEWLLSEGVTLIGTERLEPSRALLCLSRRLPCA